MYGLEFDMVRLDACIDGMGGFLDSKMTHTKNSIIKQHAYRIINLTRANADLFFNLCLYGLKFHDMLGQRTCIDGMGGFLDSNMTWRYPCHCHPNNVPLSL